MRLTATQLDRAVGAVVGGAAGDALGAGYEFTFPAPDEPIVFRRGQMGFDPGEWTDDTAQAAAILRVVADGRLDLDRIGAGFLEWFDGGPKDCGISTRSVLVGAGGDPARLRASADAYFSRHPRGAAGNGSLMRTSPVAIAHLGDDDAIADAARAVSHLTHGDPLAAEGCVLWCIAIDRAVREGRLDGVWDGVGLLAEGSRDRWVAWLREAESAPPSSFTGNGFVVVALQAAHAAITQTPVSVDQPCRHLQDALEAAVRIGRDTDTVAAIAGQVLGARWGVSAVPGRWRRMLHGWPDWECGDLVRAAVRTARGGTDDAIGWPSVPSLLDWGRQQEPVPVCVDVPDVPGLWAGNLPGLTTALDLGVEAVVSLCRVGGEDVPADVEHVEVWLSDRDGEGDNANLSFVLDDTVDTLTALLDEGRRVYVHCVGGHSRTPTVVAALVARRSGGSASAAFDALADVLPVERHNRAFAAALAAR